MTKLKLLAPRYKEAQEKITNLEKELNAKGGLSSSLNSDNDNWKKKFDDIKDKEGN